MTPPETGRIYQGDCLELMRSWPDECVELTVTSPPYDNLRAYKGYSFDFENVAQQLFRITKRGGVCVWVVGDAVIDGSESGTSFRQALRFLDVGFRLHDTMIYQKNSCPFPESNRYNQAFEYMFVLSRDTPKTFNPKRRKNILTGGVNKTSSSNRQPDGTIAPMKYELNKEDSIEWNVWRYEVGFMKSSSDPRAYEHPATFPEKLAADHIASWSNPGDLVFDPFTGSGTTPLQAARLGRRFVGCEIAPEYAALAATRVAEEIAQGKLF